MIAASNPEANKKEKAGIPENQKEIYRKHPKNHNHLFCTRPCKPEHQNSSFEP